MAGMKWTGTVPFNKVQIKEAFTKERFGIPFFFCYGTKCLFRNLSPIMQGRRSRSNLYGHDRTGS